MCLCGAHIHTTRTINNLMYQLENWRARPFPGCARQFSYASASWRRMYSLRLMW